MAAPLCAFSEMSADLKEGTSDLPEFGAALVYFLRLPLVDFFKVLLEAMQGLNAIIQLH